MCGKQQRIVAEDGGKHECAAKQQLIVTEGASANAQRTATDLGALHKCVAKQQRIVAKDRGMCEEQGASANAQQTATDCCRGLRPAQMCSKQHLWQRTKQRECPCATNGRSTKKQQSNRGQMSLLSMEHHLQMIKGNCELKYISNLSKQSREESWESKKLERVLFCQNLGFLRPSENW